MASTCATPDCGNFSNATTLLCNACDRTKDAEEGVIRHGANWLPEEELVRRGEEILSRNPGVTPGVIKDSTNSRSVAAALKAREGAGTAGDAAAAAGDATPARLPPSPPGAAAKAPALSKTVHVITMGDSTIDNLIWQDKDERGVFKVADSVIGQLRLALGGPHVVTNLAADGFTSGNVVHGAMPMLSAAAWRSAGEPFPGAAGDDRRGDLKPLECLSSMVTMGSAAAAEAPLSLAPTHVLLSVGGNDVREILQNMHRLPEVVANFHVNFTSICETIVGMGGGGGGADGAQGLNLVLMLQYQVCLTHEHGGYGVYAAMASLPGPGTGQQKLQAVMERIYAPVLELARKFNLAVIDLPRTFDPADSEL
jgi:hypothetical protein